MFTKKLIRPLPMPETTQDLQNAWFFYYGLAFLLVLIASLFFSPPPRITVTMDSIKPLEIEKHLWTAPEPVHIPVTVRPPAPKVQKVVKPLSPVKKVQQTPIKLKVTVKPVVEAKTVHGRDINVPTKPLDLDKLARAVAFAESTSCKNAWMNNCHGIKSGNTYKCKQKLGQMCQFKDRAESFTAFKVIWMRWYKTFPTYKQAHIWTGGDKTEIWLNHVRTYYNNN